MFLPLLSYMRMRDTKFLFLRKLAIIVTVIVVCALTVTTMYAKGYRLSARPLALLSPGSIRIEGILPTDLVYIDSIKTKVSLQNSTAKINTSNGTHEVVISRAGSYPWAKILTIAQDRETTVSPFFIKNNPELNVFNQSDPSFETRRTNIRLEPIPAREIPRFPPGSEDAEGGTVGIYVEGTSIIAEWFGPESTIPRFFCAQRCFSKVTVVDLKEPITSLDFLPSRNDVILFASGNQVAAIEIDRQGLQNYQPLFTGKGTVQFSLNAKNQLSIVDTESLVEIALGN